MDTYIIGNATLSSENKKMEDIFKKGRMEMTKSSLETSVPKQESKLSGHKGKYELEG